MFLKLNRKKVLRAGFIGCGRHARVNLYPCLPYLPVELAAVCTAHRNSAEIGVKRFGAQKAYTNYLEMFKHERLDAVFVCVGAEKHFEICREALRHGLHVFVEKPATENLAQAKELEKIAVEKDRYLMVGFMKRFAPTYQKAKKIIDAGKLGHLLAIDTKLCVGPKTYKTKEKFLIDLAVHHLDLVRFFGGEIRNLHVEDSSFERNGVFSFVLAIKFAGGALGSVFISSGQTWLGHNERVELTGNGRFIVIDNIVSIKYYRNGSLGNGTAFHGFRGQDNIFWEPNFSIPLETNQTLYLNGYLPEIRHFTNAILSGKKPEADITNFCQDMQLIESIKSKIA